MFNLNKDLILVIEDDANIWNLIELIFEQDPYRLLHAWNGSEAVDYLHTETPGVILIDVMLPDANGVDLCRFVRQHWPNSQILLVTSLSDVINKVLGLEAGADDYITKPFNEHELRARVRAAIRRYQAIRAARAAHIAVETALAQVKLSVADLNMSAESHLAWRQGQELDLTPKEFDLLWLLAAEPGKVFTRKDLITSLWNGENALSEQTVNGHIRRLREKVDEPFMASPLIETVRGIGYRLRTSDA